VGVAAAGEVSQTVNGALRVKLHDKHAALGSIGRYLGMFDDDSEQRGRYKRRQRKVAIWRVLQLIGASCLLVVLLTHVAEALKLFPGMGWGLPTSPGHYLDLVSAVLGCALLPLGFLGNAITRRKNSN